MAHTMSQMISNHNRTLPEPFARSYFRRKQEVTFRMAEETPMPPPMPPIRPPTMVPTPGNIAVPSAAPAEAPAQPPPMPAALEAMFSA